MNQREVVGYFWLAVIAIVVAIFFWRFLLILFSMLVAVVLITGFIESRKNKE